MASKKSSGLVWVAVIIIVIAVLYYLMKGGFHAGTTTLAIQLTDPPNVPQGTQHLFITYSALQVHVSNANSSQSGWVSAQGSGTVDLLAVVNATKTIGNANIATNSSINLVRFNITSAQIVISNTMYNMSTPNNQINIAITGTQKLNSSTAAVVIDMFPKVTFSANSYTLVPAARAIVINGNASVSINTNIGSNASISGIVKVKLGA